MNEVRFFHGRRGPSVATQLVIIGFLLLEVFLGLFAQARSTNSMIKPPVAVPGGLGAGPVITSLAQHDGLLKVEWFGLQGPYQLMHSASSSSTHWWSLGPLTLS